MSWKIGMPNLSHTMEEGKVTEWLKRVGDPVARGEAIAVVESDKASFDIEAPADGVLLSIDADAGAVVPVGAVIGAVGKAGEIVDKVDEVRPAAAPSIAGNGVAVAPVRDQARRRAMRMSPAARVLAQELGIDPDEVVASAEDGIVTRDDVRAHAARAGGQGPAQAVPLSPMRRAIASATERAWRTVPRVALNSRADVGALVEAGTPMTAAVGRATALALKEHKSFNGWLLEEGFRPSADVDLSFAVSAGGGLVTAVIPKAERKSVSDIDTELKGLARQAREGALDGGRMVGGSFAISTLGRWGVDSFDPIISLPQVAILGVGRIDRVAREAPDGGVRFASEMQLSLVFDHRANDGVEAAQLLQSIVALLEKPEHMEGRP